MRTARLRGALPGEATARIIPAIISIRAPNLTGRACVVSASSPSKELRRDLGIGGAADVERQAPVVRLSRRVGVDAHAFAEPHCDQRAMEAVLEGDPEGEVGRERERPYNLCGTNPFTLWRCSLRHAANITWAGPA